MRVDWRARRPDRGLPLHPAMKISATVGPTLRKKIEGGLKDIREGRTISLADYARRRTKLKAKQLLLCRCQSV